MIRLEFPPRGPSPERAAESPSGMSPRAGCAVRPTRVVLAIAIVVAIAGAVVVGTGSSETVATLARQSFTRLPAEYDELYFERPPTVAPGATTASIEAVIGVVHHGNARKSFGLRVELRDSSSSVMHSTDERIVLDPEQSAAVKVRLPVTDDVPDGAFVTVLSVSDGNTLLFRLPTASAEDVAGPG
jgi:hypothetical protein